MRIVALCIAVAFAIAAAFPAIALLPIAGTIANMRSPGDAPGIARAFFTASAIVVGLVCALWPQLRSALQAGVERVVAMSARAYWSLIVVVAIVPRIGVAAFVNYEPIADARWFHLAAVSLARGEGLAIAGHLTAYRPPGYPLLLSSAYRIFGADVRLAWLFGIAATVVLMLAIHVVAARQYGSAVARIAVLLTAPYPALVVMTGQAMSDVPFVAGLMALVATSLLVAPHRLRSAFVVGAALGALTLTRGVAVGLFVGVPIIWWFREPDPKRWARSALVCAVSFFVSVTPWVLRNEAVFGRATLGTNAGTNLYVGNHEGADGGAVPTRWPPMDLEVAANEAARDAALRDAALTFIVEHPGAAFAIVPRKLLALYLLETEAVTSLMQADDPAPRWLKPTLYGVSQLAYLCIVLGVCVRALDWRSSSNRPRGIQCIGWLLAGYFTLMCIVFHGEDRYRLPILPWMLIETAFVLARPRR